MSEDFDPDEIPEDEVPSDDDYPNAEEGVNAWSDEDVMFEDDAYLGWEDAQGNYHDIIYEDPPEIAELRTTFSSYDEAKDYLYEIMTEASQYFEIYYGEYGYEVYYMGGTD